ncbi:MAG: hypothetical protein IPM29_17620 [Planctomycetes bacterium]|nr:hypothetical protein [Planctomycetota bacterium]
MSTTSPGQAGPPTRYVRRVFLLVGVALVAAALLQRAARPATWGELGNYRTAGLTAILATEPVHLGKEGCARCHAEIFGLHEKDFHFDVECEDCHTPGREHVRFHDRFPTGGDPALAALASMPKEYTREGCLFCHRRLGARPRAFAQIEPAEHYAFLGVNDPQTRCIACHSPHEPIFLLAEVKRARIHPVIHECIHCHDTKPEGDYTQVDSHPAMFVCSDCHEGIVEDFESRKHSFMRCTACHLYHPENEDSGRILVNGNRRFCLLCHEDAPFRTGAKQPLVDSKAHLEMIADALELDAAELAADPRACLRCHLDKIHGDVVRK